MSLTDGTTEYEIGGLSDSKKITARFTCYEVEQRSDEIIIRVSLDNGEIPEYKMGYGLEGQRLLVSLCNLWQEVCSVPKIDAADKIVSWCRMHVHPYYFYGEPFQRYNWAQEHDPVYWDTMVNILGDYDFKLNKMLDDLQNLYEDTIILKSLFEYLDDTTRAQSFERIQSKEKRALFTKWKTSSEMQRYTIIANYLATLPKCQLTLSLGENLRFQIVPDFRSVFDVAYYALMEFVTMHLELPIKMWSKTSIAFCACCGNLFIKNGNRQKYCDDPECKKERDRRKSRASYRRKIDKELEEMLS
jgi:hypothetical protein